MQAYAAWFGEAGMTWLGSAPATAEELRARNPDVVVTPGRARELLERTIARWPVTDLYWWAIPPGVAPGRTVRSLELFSRLVLS